VTGTITLEEVEELVIDKDLVIEGPGASSLSVSGGYSEDPESPSRYGRVFRIEAGATVSISGLTITGGSRGLPAAASTTRARCPSRIAPSTATRRSTAAGSTTTRET
jgi:hypothetical protein